MQINESLSQAKLPARLPVPSEKALLTTVAAAFLLLHLLAGMVVLRAAANETMTPQQQARATFYD
jgi:hypothetical protein